ncbi:MAG: transglutaminase family protein [Deltaproteobacteria bacterium]|nr:transglutaminase family protein [Deltaproteobacteria bacterium]
MGIAAPRRDELAHLLAQPEESIDLGRAALLVARDHDPRCDVDEGLARLDRLADPLRGVLRAETPVLEAALTLAAHLGARERFRGNVEQYDDPANSFLHAVLERRLGIPITLSLVYMEVARRCNVAAHGVGLPGHFLTGLSGPVPGADGSTRTGVVMLDPFDGGRLMRPRAVADLYARYVGSDATLPPDVLRPVSRKALLARMLRNLKGVYAKAGDTLRTLSVLDRILSLAPGALEERRERGLLLAQAGAARAARDDLETYLANANDVEHAAEARAVLAGLSHRRPTLLN